MTQTSGCHSELDSESRRSFVVILNLIQNLAVRRHSELDSESIKK